MAAAGGLLAVAGLLGTFLRPTSDDWCVAWKTRDMGVWGVTSDFYLTQNGRITNALISGIVYSQGMLGPQVLPTVLIIALGLGLYLLGSGGPRRVGHARPRGGSCPRGAGGGGSAVPR
ncbi:hypothetical protein ADK75_30135 [Streptomyces virginiae]|uniref:Uncharacterized protein n=1 Tax=Streptomyces virginiae TaxID=1961 RepID=A0A0L8M5P9_STRVG|nr:hypothetical protein ADK75_30135 [Streptomyces virginiae]